MSDAERMARAFRTALHNCNNTWEDFNDTNRMRSVYRDYVAAAQSLLDAGWRPPQQETTVNEATHIGGWEKLDGYDLRFGRHDDDAIKESDAEAMAINGCIEELTTTGFLPNGHPILGENARLARERLAPLGITAETLRAKGKRVRVKCPKIAIGWHTDPTVAGCPICKNTGEYDAELVEDANAD